MRRLVDRFVALLDRRGPLTRADRPLWASTRTLPDLAELTAQWLEGRIASQPGYGRVDVHEDDAPDLTTALIALNRAGYLTNDSQAGYDGEGYDGAHWQQVAAVTGFASWATVDWLADALVDTGFRIIARPCRTRWQWPDPGVVVTYRDGVPVAEYGRQLDAPTIADLLYEGCGDAAIEAVCAAMQVTIYDPEPASNCLWSVLRAVAGRQLAEDDSR